MSIAYLAHLENLAAIAGAIDAGDCPTAADLAALTGVCPRQVHRYLTTLRKEFGAPIPLDPKQRGYRFARAWSFEKAFLVWLRDAAAKRRKD